MIRLLLASFLACGLAALRATSADGPPTGQQWDRAAAASYLDARMDAWFANAKKLRTGQVETPCISCHTAVPYALARPALRKAMGMSVPTPAEVRLLEVVTARVETYASHQPFYDSSESKTIESRGTEAILNALILASEDARRQRTSASEPTRKAFDRLWATERPDGAWDWLQFGLEPWESVDAPYYGATLAALALGLGRAAGPSAADVTEGGAEAGGRAEKLRGFLKERYARQSLFNRTWALLASTRFEDLLTRAQRDALVGEIASRQNDAGGWSLESLGIWKWAGDKSPFAPPGSPDAALLAAPDAYATGLVVYALRQAGLAADHPAVSTGLAWLRANQRDVRVDGQTWTAWRAHSLNFDREHGGDKGEPWRRLFMSDAATAFAVLALTSAE